MEVTDPAAGGHRTELEQAVIECAPRASISRATGEVEEVLFVLAGNGGLALDGNRYELEPESGAYLAPGEEYELDNPGSEPLRVVSVRIPDPVTPAADAEAGEARAVVRRLAEQEEQDGDDLPHVPDRGRPQHGPAIGDSLRRLRADGPGARPFPHLRRSHLRA